MDIKVEGITPEIMKVALDQAQAGRLHILGEMNKVLSTPRAKMSRVGAVDHHASRSTRRRSATSSARVAR